MVNYAPPEDTDSSPQDEPAIGMADKFHMVRGLFSSAYFRKIVRPRLYRKAGNDPERMHELTTRLLSENHSVLRMISGIFRHPRELYVSVKGKPLAPFGTAAGLDKNGDALKAFSYFFGFMEPGTVVASPRKGNDRPRVAVDEQALDVYNAQGFPSKGLAHFKERMIDYRKSGGRTPVYVSICGLPISEEKAIDVAMGEMAVLLRELNEYADGFVWNPFSPNTAALKLLMEPELFKQTSELMKRHAPDKLRLVKMGPYEEHERPVSMKLAGSFIDGGGDGIVTTNTKMHPREQVPHPAWGYKSAGRSGSFLRPYRLRAVRQTREEFPDSLIIATGGIYDGDDAYETFKSGANLLEGYTPYTFYGLGLLRDIEKRVARRLKQDGYAGMEEMQASAKR